MWANEILLLLSSHRHPGQMIRPAALSMTQILSLLRHNLDPKDHASLLSQVEDDLQELEVQGEILAASGNRYCVAPPMVLAIDRHNLTGLKFQGDRAYLALTHKALETKQLVSKEMLYPKTKNFNRLQKQLQEIQVRLLIVHDLIQNLPKPEKPLSFHLNKRLITNTDLQSWMEQGLLERYVPQWGEQRQRWQKIPENPETECLLRHTNEYFWFEAGNFYEIERDAAVLTMFYQDTLYKAPLSIVWDTARMNRLNLQGITLPTAHAQAIWRLSEPQEDQTRIRSVTPGNRTFVTAILNQLGCNLQ
jgi:hypothetical protein